MRAIIYQKTSANKASKALIGLISQAFLLNIIGVIEQGRLPVMRSLPCSILLAYKLNYLKERVT